MTSATGQKLASLLIALAGVGGFVALLVLCVHHPHAAPVLRLLAFLWLLSCGAAKLVFDLTETAGREDDRAKALRHARE